MDLGAGMACVCSYILFFGHVRVRATYTNFPAQTRADYPTHET